MKKKLFKLIAEGDIENVLEILLSSTDSREPIILSARYVDLKRKERMGVLKFDDFALERNRIIEAIINVIDIIYSDIINDGPNNDTKFSNKKAKDGLWTPELHFEDSLETVKQISNESVTTNPSEIICKDLMKITNISSISELIKTPNVVLTKPKMIKSAWQQAGFTDFSENLNMFRVTGDVKQLRKLDEQVMNLEKVDLLMFARRFRCVSDLLFNFNPDYQENRFSFKRDKNFFGKAARFFRRSLSLFSAGKEISTEDIFEILKRATTKELDSTKFNELNEVKSDQTITLIIGSSKEDKNIFEVKNELFYRL